MKGAEVVGDTLEICSAFPPNEISTDMDLKNLDEVEGLIHAVQNWSGRESLSFEFQLDASYVGSVDDGVINRILLEGLLLPWQDNLKGEC